MTTITIKNSKNAFSKTNFENPADLYEYLTQWILDEENSLSDAFKYELDQREKELLTGNVKGVNWQEIKADFLAPR